MRFIVPRNKRLLAAPLHTALSVFNGYSIFMEANMSKSLRIAYFEVWPNNPGGSWPRRTQISCTYFGSIKSHLQHLYTLPLVTCCTGNFRNASISLLGYISMVCILKYSVIFKALLISSRILRLRIFCLVLLQPIYVYALQTCPFKKKV